MQLLFVSDCQKAALARTRKVLDRYLPRLGGTVWGGPLTQEALEDVQQQLKAVASKNTSVSCFKVTRTDQELLFVVGHSARQTDGARHIATLKRTYEMPQRYRVIALATRLAGYLHDLGKATKHFQQKLLDAITPKANADSDDEDAGDTDELIPKTTASDAIRHEWISAWLAEQLLVDNPPEQLTPVWREWEVTGLPRVQNTVGLVPEQQGSSRVWVPRVLLADPAQSDPTVHAANMVVFLVLSHHRALYNKASTRTEIDRVPPAKHDLINAHVPAARSANSATYILDERWDADAAGFEALWADARALWLRLRTLSLTIAAAPSPAYWQALSLPARACLLCADHEVSSENYVHPTARAHRLMANTTNTTKNKSAKKEPRKLNQPLLEHLRNVGDAASRWAITFANPELPRVSAATVERLLQPVAHEAYVWQDRAVEHLQGAEGHGHLIFNIAGTGAGKTIGNLKCLAALRPKDLRVSAGFNLRTLTLQTRLQYAQAIGNESSPEVVCVLGDTLSIKLNETPFACDVDEPSVPASEAVADAVVAGDPSIDMDPAPEWLDRIPKFIKGKRADNQIKILAAPILLSTLDQVVAAGDIQDTVPHPLALLRVRASDLIIDEADSLDVSGLVALLRLVKMAAFFERNLVISSATLPPVMASAIFEAWCAGARLKTAVSSGYAGRVHLIGDSPLLPVQMTAQLGHPAGAFTDEYSRLAGEHAKLALGSPTKRATIQALAYPAESTAPQWVDTIRTLHDFNHETDEALEVSIGLIRVANIAPGIALTRKLTQTPMPSDTRIVVTCYHAKDLLIRRSFKERHLDKLLTRKGATPWFKQHQDLPEIAAEITAAKAAGQRRLIFVVVASPVEEVGRDHDFDWGIIDPSSMSSIIQTAGRVNRHRKVHLPENVYNIVILEKNIKHQETERLPKKPGKSIFPYRRPGFQADKNTHMAPGTRTKVGDPLTARAMLPAMPIFQVTAALSLAPAPAAGEAPDRGRTQFAEEDSRAISNQLARPLAEIVASPERPASCDVSWMSAWCELKYPLRERETGQRLLAFDPDLRQIGLVEFLTKDGRREPRLLVDEECYTYSDTPAPNTWLNRGIESPEIVEYWRKTKVNRYLDKLNLFGTKIPAASDSTASTKTTATVFGIERKTTTTKGDFE